MEHFERAKEWANKAASETKTTLYTLTNFDYRLSVRESLGPGEIVLLGKHFHLEKPYIVPKVLTSIPGINVPPPPPLPTSPTPPISSSAKTLSSLGDHLRAMGSNLTAAAASIAPQARRPSFPPTSNTPASSSRIPRPSNPPTSKYTPRASPSHSDSPLHAVSKPVDVPCQSPPRTLRQTPNSYSTRESFEQLTGPMAAEFLAKSPDPDYDVVAMSGSLKNSSWPRNREPTRDSPLVEVRDPNKPSPLSADFHLICDNDLSLPSPRQATRPKHLPEPESHSSEPLEDSQVLIDTGTVLHGESIGTNGPGCGVFIMEQQKGFDLVTHVPTVGDSQSSSFAMFHAMWSSLPWFTYRTNFIFNEATTTDTGWGCVHRAGQMILARAMLVAFHGRVIADNLGAGLASASPNAAEHLERYRIILSQFEDTNGATFSLQNICRTGAAKFKTPAGNWYPPSRIAKILSDLSSHFGDLVVHHIAALEESISQDRLAQLAQSRNPPLWTPLVLFVSLKLGPEELNPAYAHNLVDLFSWPQFLGFVGGKKDSSLYFTGVLHGADKETYLLYLDPHHPRPVQPLSAHSTAAQNPSYHTFEVRTVPLMSVAPEMVLGFLMQSRADMESVLDRMRQQPAPALFHVADDFELVLARERHASHISHGDDWSDAAMPVFPVDDADFRKPPPPLPVPPSPDRTFDDLSIPSADMSYEDLSMATHGGAMSSVVLVPRPDAHERRTSSFSHSSSYDATHPHMRLSIMSLDESNISSC